MHFTVVFESHESQDLSFGLVFIPCPVWIRGGEQVCTPNPESPDYQIGAVRKLLQSTVREEFNHDSCHHACILTHLAGHGTTADLDRLREDLIEEGFSVTVQSFRPT